MAISEEVEQIEDDAVGPAIEQLIEQKVEEKVEQKVEEIRQEKNERIAELENELEKRPKIRMDGDDIRSIQFGEKKDSGGTFVPLGQIVAGARNDISDIDDRVFALEQDEVDVSDIIDGTGSDDQLPIQRATDARKKDVHDFGGNKLRATYVWPTFNKRSKPDGTKLTLYSWQVKQILDDNDLNTNPATVRRTMEFVAKLTSEKPKDERDPKDEDNLVVFNNDGSENTLVAQKDEWEEFFSNQIDASLNGTDAVEEGDEDTTTDDATENVDGDVMAEKDALMQASAVTPSSEDDVEDEAGIEVTR